MIFEAVRNRDWIIACNHAMDLLILLGEDETKLPQASVDVKNTNQMMQAYADLYVKLSRMIAKKVKSNIDLVRKIYRDKSFEIPKIQTGPVAA